MDDYPGIADLDVIAAAAAAHPGKAIAHRFDTPQFTTAKYARLMAYCRKYKFGTALCTAIANLPRDLHTFMTLVRAGEQDYFDEHDRQWDEMGWTIAVRERDRLDTLSPREREVALRFARDESYTQIAAALGLSPATVRRHIQRAYERLGVHSKLELAALLGSNGAAGRGPKITVSR